MGCSDNKSDDERYDEMRANQRRSRAHQYYQEDEEESNIDEEDFKDFEEIGSKSKNY